VGGHAVLAQRVERAFLLLGGTLALPAAHGVEPPGQGGTLLGVQRSPGLAAHRRDPALVAMSRQGEVEMHPGELLAADLLEGGRTAAHHALLLQLG